MGRSVLLVFFMVTALFKLSAWQSPEVKAELALPQNKTTVVYLVRHAEKITDNPQEQDPGLTNAGLKRAADLKQFLKDVAIDAFFSTPYKRTQLTLSPLANGRPIQFYEAHDFAGLRKRILTDFRGKTILVAGHSNTVLPIIEALGGKKPLKEITDNQYDNIFKISISPRGKVMVRAQKYGNASH